MGKVGDDEQADKATRTHQQRSAAVIQALQSSRSHLLESEEDSTSSRFSEEEGEGQRSRGGREERNMSMRYSRVANNETTSSPAGATDDEETKKRRSALAERISNKLHAALWTVIGGAVMYYTDFVKVLLEDERVDRLWFNIASVTFSVNVIIMLYLVVWLPYVQRIRISWNVYCPRVIPTATAFGVVCAISLNVALWSVWGLLTPLVLFAVFVGFLMMLHFIPLPL